MMFRLEQSALFFAIVSSTTPQVTVVSDNDNCVINLLIPGTRVISTQVKIEFIKKQIFGKEWEKEHMFVYMILMSGDVGLILTLLSIIGVTVVGTV